MGHDHVWKDIIWTFFESFIRLFVPEIADSLDFSTAQLVEGEVFTDLPEGSRREPDIVVQIDRADSSPEIILIHLEVQSERRKEISYRMWEYYSLLRLRKKLPVFPINVYLTSGSGGLVTEYYREELFGIPILEFAYRAVGLPDLSAELFENEIEPLAVSLSTMMRSQQGSRVRRKLRALSRLANADLDDARSILLRYVVDKYLNLSELEKKEMTSLIESQSTPDNLKRYMGCYEELLREQGKRELIIRLIRLKFGESAQSAIDSLANITNTIRLDEISDRLLTANTIDELELN